MDFLKALFESGAITWEQFVEGVTKAGYKLADLSTGNYVAKKKYEDELSAKDTAIETLNGQITTRDTDIKNLQKQLKDAGNDATKLADLTSQLEALQTNYDNAKTDYENQLAKQSYEFAVKEFVNGQKFTSNAAKRDFTNEMIGANLKMKNNNIIGASDFLTSYTEANPDAFVVEAPEGDNNPPAPTTPAEPKPMFIQPTTPTPQGNTNAFDGVFNFSGVRGH